MASEWQREQARKQARAEGKVPAGDKKRVVRKGLTQKEQAQKDIDLYKAKQGTKKDTRTLRSITRYGKPDSTATSGGSKAVRKIDPKFKGETTAARTKDGDLVDRLRRNKPKYFKTSK